MNSTIHVHDITRITHRRKRQNNTQWMEIKCMDEAGGDVMTLVAFMPDASEGPPMLVDGNDANEGME